jgi:hypothetical protein
VFDEYHSALISAKILSEGQSTINPIFELGQTRQTIMISGHKSKEMIDFLSTYFGRDNIEILHFNSVLFLTG